MMFWTVLLGLVALVWLSRHSAVNQAQREQTPLNSDSYAGPPDNPPFVSVLIAAKDEEANIETAVRSMLAQDYPNFELIAIDDRSSDRTGEILESIKTEQPEGKLQVIHIQKLREGWFGKNNAMREGVERARGQWLCFSDADCKQTSNRTLSMAVGHVLEENIDFLSVLPRLETQSLWERIIQPVCGAVMVLWFNPKKVNHPDHPAAYANGAFMLMTRGCYQTIGQHEAVCTEVNEDMHMARIAKEKKQRLKVMSNDDLYTVRMYCGFKEIWRGWSRIFYGCFGTFRRLRLTLLVLVVMNLFPYISAVISGLILLTDGWASTGMDWRAVAMTSLLCIVLQQSVIVRFYRLSKADPRYAPTFIIGAVLCSGMLINAIFKLKGRTTTTWRGDTYRGDKVE
ncbi:MAG: glycosyltransferase family 2 protein [Planctomycetota bacterium]